jgi:hypothetical protein
MDPILVGLFIPLASLAVAFGIVYIIVSARNKERMALIEKGADPHLFESVKKGNSHLAIKWGIFLFGIGLGVVVAEILVKNEVMSEDSAYFAMIFIFGGLALVASHLLLRKKELKEEEKI